MAAFVHCNFRSNILCMSVDVSVLLPDNERSRLFLENKQEPVKYKTLYLLHGFTGDYMSYLRTSNIERYADEYQIMVVMPSIYNSAYTDMKYGLDYFTYLSKELMHFIELTFPASQKREERFVAGMSMGGYGAYKFGLSCPEKFCAIGGSSRCLSCRIQISGKGIHSIYIM